VKKLSLAVLICRLASERLKTAILHRYEILYNSPETVTYKIKPVILFLLASGRLKTGLLPRLKIHYKLRATVTARYLMQRMKALDVL